MGLTKVTTKLTSLVDSQKSFESLFLVDPGATDSMAPSDELEKLGVKQEGKMAYELADGTVRDDTVLVWSELNSWEKRLRAA